MNKVVVLGVWSSCDLQFLYAVGKHDSVHTNYGGHHYVA